MDARRPGDQEQAYVLPRGGLGGLLGALRARGYEVVGPTLRDGAIVCDPIAREEDLPIGWTDVQEPGKCRLERRPDEAVFGYAVGPHSYKKLFHVPEERLYTVRRQGKSLRFVPEPVAEKKLALFGARGCDLAALRVQDRVLLGDLYGDARYAARRADVLVVAVHCGVAGGTCFCASMGTGPRAGGPWDLAATELIDEAGHRFLIEVGSDVGREIVRELGLAPAPAADRSKADGVVEHTARSFRRRLETDGIRSLLENEPEHPRWAQVAERCLSCTNCTMVCPTCFCTTMEDTTDLEGGTAERARRWDSCFTLDFSRLHAGPARSSVLGRYRQWMTHKLATWIDQFGTSGCVGCGRCITWCPVGIDITEEAAAIRATSAPPSRE